MIDKELKLRQQRATLQAHINALINEPADAPLGKPVGPGVSDLTTDLSSLVQLADTSSLLLKAWRTTIKGVKQSEQCFLVTILKQ